MKAILAWLHHHAIFKGRVAGITEALSSIIPTHSRILDVGAGDGRIAKGFGEATASLAVEGIDVMLRPDTKIPVSLFDGSKIPFPDDSFDVVTFVDVLHHTDDPDALLKEAARVASTAVVIKDHLCENAVDHFTLRAMDWVGNAPHGVVLPYNYAAHKTWLTWFETANLTVEEFSTQVKLYPAPLSWIFGRRLHFVARLSV